LFTAFQDDGDSDASSGKGIPFHTVADDVEEVVDEDSGEEEQEGEEEVFVLSAHSERASAAGLPIADVKAGTSLRAS
jgi:hypothetical protein